MGQEETPEEKAMNQTKADETPPPVTIPAASETRRNTATCSHLDMSGETAIENYDGIPWCFICGARIDP